ENLILMTRKRLRGVATPIGRSVQLAIRAGGSARSPPTCISSFGNPATGPWHQPCRLLRVSGTKNDHPIRTYEARLVVAARARRCRGDLGSGGCDLDDHPAHRFHL